MIVAKIDGTANEVKDIQVQSFIYQTSYTKINGTTNEVKDIQVQNVIY